MLTSSEMHVTLNVTLAPVAPGAVPGGNVTLLTANVTLTPANVTFCVH
jgi:hypothetical protein